MGLCYLVVLRPLSEEEGGGWLAEIPDLPGCMSGGETPGEALRAVEEAQDAWLKVARVRRVRVPVPVKEGLHALRLHPSPERETSCEARARLDELAGAAYEAYWEHVRRGLPGADLPPALWCWPRGR
ncbi:MAG: type II toxin-antitoxin system HicB family antitoxin [Bacillota bacterium]|nr:type II toxin-antitoxin system HicB family antitoxin [Bacillota bacterium]